MLVLIDERKVVRDAYCASFGKLGRVVEEFAPEQFFEWLVAARRCELEPVEAFLLGDCPDVEGLVKAVNLRANAPVMALAECTRLDTILRLFEAGADDIVRKPVHVQEILCRIHAIRRRTERAERQASGRDVQIYFDGRDPIIGGAPLQLPRRERRVLEFFAANTGKRVSKEQVFNAIYGIFEDSVNECVVESHISKLRKKLKAHLGYDPIDSKRYLGYCFSLASETGEAGRSSPVAVDNSQQPSVSAVPQTYGKHRELQVA